MKIESLLVRVVVGLLVLGVVAPFLLFFVVKDKALAAQIGDALGGSSAPLINISAIVAVIATLYYQRRNDQRNARRALIAENFLSLKEELNNINDIKKITKSGNTVVENNIGKDAIKSIIKSLNAGEYKNFDVRELVVFSPILNVYKYFELLIQDVKHDSILLEPDKKMILLQFQLFY